MIHVAPDIGGTELERILIHEGFMGKSWWREESS